uniref:Cadherin domain-containing protein n=1 Tax=Vombatus ursinus TaxID=29139 RepID=A0A4X2KKN3_VOMUR
NVTSWIEATSVSRPAVTSELHVEVPENYAGNFPLYLKKLKLPPVHSEGPTVVHVADDEVTEGLFGVESDSGFLFVTRPLDREEQAQYTLQVTITAEDGSLLWGPQSLIVHVKDVNDHVPEFTKAEYTETLSQGTHADIPFFYLSAIDGDEPGTANSDLRYHILSQTPAQPSLDMFQLEARTGGLALTEKGSSGLDPTTVSHYQLLVQVKDLGDQASGHRTMATPMVLYVDGSSMILQLDYFTQGQWFCDSIVLCYLYGSRVYDEFSHYHFHYHQTSPLTPHKGG